ncbi:hypothetical protein GCM10027444_08590 [Actinopolyspora lacussalsi]
MAQLRQRGDVRSLVPWVGHGEVDVDEVLRREPRHRRGADVPDAERYLAESRDDVGGVSGSISDTEPGISLHCEQPRQPAVSRRTLESGLELFHHSKRLSETATVP